MDHLDHRPPLHRAPLRRLRHQVDHHLDHRPPLHRPPYWIPNVLLVYWMPLLVLLVVVLPLLVLLVLPALFLL